MSPAKIMPRTIMIQYLVPPLESPKMFPSFQHTSPMSCPFSRSGRPDVRKPRFHSSFQSL